jgi:hypothetical protein
MGRSPGKFREQSRFMEEISDANFSEEASKQISRM